MSKRARSPSTAASSGGLSEYEQLRQERIRENRAFLEGLGLEEAKQALRGLPKSRKHKQPRARMSATRHSARSRD